MTRSFRAAALLAVGLLALRPLSAQTTVTWVGTTAAFGTAANWSPATVPGSSAIAQFSGTAAATTVAVGSASEVAGVTFAAGAAAYTLNATALLTVGSSGVVNAAATQQTLSGSLYLAGSTPTITTSGTGGTLISATFAIDNNGTLTVSGAGNTTLSGAVSGDAGNLVKTGTGTLTLTGAHSYSGGVTVNAGTLTLSGGGSLYSSTNTANDLTVAAGATFRLDGVSQTVTTLAGAGTVALDGGTLALGAPLFYSYSPTTFDGAITGTGGLVKNFYGQLTLSGNNTYSGGTTIARDNIAVGSDTALGTGTLTIDPNWLGSGSSSIITAVGGARTLANAIVMPSTVYFGDDGYDLTLAGPISGAGSIGKTGSNTLTLSGNNTYTGGAFLNAGTVAIGSDTALGTATYGHDVLLNGATLVATGGARTVTQSFYLAAATTIGGSQPLTLAGTFTLGGYYPLTLTNTARTTISATIGDGGLTYTLIKQGSGELQLTGANTYSGGTLLAAGTTIINNATGSAFGTGAVTVASGATLTGAGSFSGAFQNNGIFSPGNSPTLDTLSSFNQGSTGTLVMELGGLDRGTGYDALDITGSATFGGTLEVTFYNGFTAAAGNSFDLFNWGSASGTFATVNLPALAGGLTWDTSALYATGVLSVAAVPEPAAYAVLLGLGAFGLVCLARRRGDKHRTASTR